MTLGWIVSGMIVQQMALRAQFREIILQREAMTKNTQAHFQQVLMNASDRVVSSLNAIAERLLFSVYGTQFKDMQSQFGNFIDAICKHADFNFAFEQEVQSGNMSALIYAERIVQKVENFEEEISRFSNNAEDNMPLKDYLGIERITSLRIKLCVSLDKFEV